MSQWKSNANNTGQPKWDAFILQQGSGNAAEVANNTALLVNTTAGAFVAHGTAWNKAVGSFPITPGAKANTNGESAKVHALGWAIRTAGEGPITGITVANGNFVNGETVLFSGGSVNAIGVLTTNATGNLASAVPAEPGGSYTYANGIALPGVGLFVNTSPNNWTATFSRELHVANLNITNASGGFTNMGDANVIQITIGNTNITYGVSAVGVFVSNTTGGANNTQTRAITWSGNTAPTANATGYWGLFANGQTNTALTFSLINSANNAVVGGVGTMTANLTPSTGGNAQISTLGGRAGRVTYEVTAVDRHINATATSTVANSIVLPQ